MRAARVLHSNGDRRRGARPYGNIRSPRKREDRACIAGRRCEGNTAYDRRDAEDLRLVIGVGVEERECIADARIDVDDQRLELLRHGSNLSSA